MSGEILAPELWEQVKTVFDAVLEHPPAVRQAAIERETDDEVVRREVRALLEAHTGAEEADFLGLPAHLAENQRLGPYTIAVHLGSGGMGDVYRAHDDRLDRDVAIKLLKAHATDGAALIRFEREAKAIAALSHPNILAIYDVGDDGSGRPYLVTELLSGETLRERLDRDPTPPIETVIDWASQIASGLGAAHGEGLVHRDLKPENVFLCDSGRVKILDFGLARPLDVPETGPTSPGLVIGTLGYLSPEQARGQPATAATDLFALGAILYESLTGERAFRGDGGIDTIRRVVDHDPQPPSTLRADVPRWLDQIVVRCLAKKVSERFQSAADLAFALEARIERTGPTATARDGRRLRAGLLAVGFAAVAAAGGFALGNRAPVLAARPVVATVAGVPMQPVRLTDSGWDRAPAVSPGGEFIAFESSRSGRSQIWLHQLETASEIALTDGPDTFPRFSPDGSQLLFTRFENRSSALYRVPLVGGVARKVVDDAISGDWSPDGSRIVFVRWSDRDRQAKPRLMISSIDGGDERELATLNYRVFVAPRWSPDGSMIAVSGLGQQPGTQQVITLVEPDNPQPRELPAANRVGLVSSLAWLDDQSIVYSQASSVSGNSAGSTGQVVAQRIDGSRVRTLLWTPEASLTLDRWGERGIVFDARSSRQILHEINRTTGESRVLTEGVGTARQPALSPDGRSIVFTSNRGSNLDIWTINRATGETRRLTDHPADDWDPAFTPDGAHVLWSSNRTGRFEVWIANVDGTNPRQVTRDGDAENPTATADGEWIVYSSGEADRRGIWRVRPDGSGAERIVPDVILPQVSPDGKLVSFQTSRGPNLEIVGVAVVATGEVLPFEIQAEVYRPNTVRLGRSRWTPDGKAIAFTGQSPDGHGGIYLQAFEPGRDTSGTRIRLDGFDRDSIPESFDIGQDLVVVAKWEQQSVVIGARGLEGL